MNVAAAAAADAGEDDPLAAPGEIFIPTQFSVQRKKGSK